MAFGNGFDGTTTPSTQSSVAVQTEPARSTRFVARTAESAYDGMCASLACAQMDATEAPAPLAQPVRVGTGLSTSTTSTSPLHRSQSSVLRDPSDRRESVLPRSPSAPALGLPPTPAAAMFTQGGVGSSGGELRPVAGLTLTPTLTPTLAR